MSLGRVADILGESLGLSQEQILEAETLGQGQHLTLKAALLKKKMVSEAALLEVYARHFKMPFFPRLETGGARVEFTREIPIHFLKKYTLVPLIRETESWIVLNDLDSFQAADDLVRRLDLGQAQWVFAPQAEIRSAINTFYDRQNHNAQQIVDDLEDAPDALDALTPTSDLLDDTSDAPMIKLVNHIISQSVKAKASDIHIEPGPETLKVRYRIDGILYDLLDSPKWIQAPLTTRIKVMADMDIAEKRLPQDSRIEVRMGNRDIDIRISTIPTSLGERIVLRLLDKSSALLTLSEFDLDKKRLEQIRRLSALPNGIVLITGPTGSGKTTTLYAMLSEINTPDINIITVEDPVEYKLAGISQIQVNPKIGLTFAKSLRSIVRQDPDVILIGEIRDQETSAIAVQSALTGHLVLSTLHTNDAAAAVTRLTDMGVEPFLITSSVRAVVAQRLVRLLCPDCKTPWLPDSHTLARLGLTLADCGDHTIFRAKGCPHCFNTGYRGRMPIFELLEFTPRVKTLVLDTADANKIRDAAMEEEMRPLMADGVEKVFAGVTTLEEVLRVTQV